MPHGEDYPIPAEQLARIREMINPTPEQVRMIEDAPALEDIEVSDDRVKRFEERMDLMAEFQKTLSRKP